MKDLRPSLQLREAEQGPTVEGAEHLVLQTDAGPIPCRLHKAREGNAAVIWVGGAGGGLDGPASCLYARLAERLAQDNYASLRLHYRQPGRLRACVLDTRVGIVYLGTRGSTRVALAGHSFGGAVVITAGSLSPAVVAVAALSSQTYGTQAVNAIRPRPLLLMHGTADEVLPDACSRDLYRRAGEPKRLLLYSGCGHGLEECREDVDRDLLQWLREALSVQVP